MAYRYRSRNRRIRKAGAWTSGAGRSQKNYALAQTTTKRHQYQGSSSQFASILSGEYASLTLAKFERNSGTPPTATASNNYQNNKVYNGGEVRNFSAHIYAKSLSSSTTFKIDVYAVALSFYDALVWDTVISTSCPVSFSVAAGSEGEVVGKTPTATLITPNNIANYKFVQHYIKKIGSFVLSPTDGGSTVATLHLTDKDYPAKCRRANLGMYFGLFFHNDAAANASGNFTGTLEYDISFDEIPSADPLPYLF